MEKLDTFDRVAAAEIACQAERDAIARAELAGNWVALQHNRARLVAAEDRLTKAAEAAN